MCTLRNKQQSYADSIELDYLFSLRQRRLKIHSPSPHGRPVSRSTRIVRRSAFPLRSCRLSKPPPNGLFISCSLGASIHGPRDESIGTNQKRSQPLLVLRVLGEITQPV